MTRLLIVPPLTVTPAMLVSTNVDETDEAAYVAGTTYAQGERVMVVADHAVYESLVAGNVGNTPATSPTKWIKVGPTNRWRLFDGANSTQTARASSISYRLTPGIVISTLALLNISDAFTVRLRVIDPTYGTVYDKTTDLGALMADSTWWAWYFGTRLAADLLIATDLPTLPGADVLVDISGGTGLAVGVLQIGQAVEVGITVQTGARFGVVDYSRKERNQFGDVVVVQRAFAKRASFVVSIRRSEIDGAYLFLARYRTTPCLFIGSLDLAVAAVFGFYKSLDVLVNYSTVAECSLEIEGLT